MKLKSSQDSKSSDIADYDIEQVLNHLIETALNQKVSDIHIEPRKENIRIRYRIDGILREAWNINKDVESSLIFKIKIAAKLRTDLHLAPQDGRILFELDNGRNVDTRISILPTSNGEKIVIRLLTKEGKSFDLNDLGLVGRDFELLTQAYLKPYGTILTVGPTGSGKTTTLYGILKNLNSPEKNITTIEDPVEYNMSGVNHIQINSKTDLTFANGLRSILRQDPDIIMVGEIRDSETAKIATNAAMTGHLVLSTLHTNDSVTTIPRLLDMGVERFLIASTLNLIVAQRLARRLCTHCKISKEFTKVDHNHLTLIRPDLANLIEPGESYFRANNCNKCMDGYNGRIGLYEVLQITKGLRNLILLNANEDDIWSLARSEGLTLIIEDAIKKLKLGFTSIDEIIRVTAVRV